MRLPASTWGRTLGIGTSLPHPRAPCTENLSHSLCDRSSSVRLGNAHERGHRHGHGGVPRTRTEHPSVPSTLFFDRPEPKTRWIVRPKCRRTASKHVRSAGDLKRWYEMPVMLECLEGGTSTEYGVPRSEMRQTQQGHVWVSTLSSPLLVVSFRFASHLRYRLSAVHCAVRAARSLPAVLFCRSQGPANP